MTTSLDDDVDGVEHRDDAEDGVRVLRQDELDSPLGGPGLADPLISSELPELGEGGGGEVLHEREALYAQCSLSIGGDRHRLPFVSEGSNLQLQAAKSDQDGGRHRPALLVLGPFAQSEGLLDGVGQLGDGVEVVVGFGSCEQGSYDPVIGSFRS